MASTPEGKVKDKVKKVLKARGAWYYMPVSNGMGVVGIPDIIGHYKGWFFGIETKRPNKRPTTPEQRWLKCTPNQRLRIEEIRDAGGLAIVCDDPAQVEELLDTIEALVTLKGE